MQQLLIPDAFKILSESYKKIGDLGVQVVDANGDPAQPALINQLISVTMLYDVIMGHVVLNNTGTAIATVLHQDIEVINDLLFSLKEVADLPKLPVFPTPITTYQFNFGDGGFGFDIGPGVLGDLIVHNGTVWTNFNMGPPGTVLTSTPTGLIWSANAGNGLPSGGTTNQYLRKNSNTSYDVVWDTLNLAKITDVTASAAEVNILDGATLSTVELNYVDGVTSPIQDQLDSKMSNSLNNGQFFVGNASNLATAVTPTGDVTFTNAGVFSISAGVIVDADISSLAAITRAKLATGTANRMVINSSIGVMTDAAAINPDQVLVSDSNGIPVASPVTAATLLFVDATSSIQTQLDGKLSVNFSTVAQGDIITYNGSSWTNFGIGTNGQVLTSNGSSVYWGSATANGLPVGGTASQYLRKIDGSDYNTEWHTLVLGDITNISTTAAEINQLSGLTVGSTQLNFLTGISNNVQTQLDNKQDNSLAYNALWVGNGSNIAAELSPGTNGYVLTMVGGTPQWQPTTPPGNVSGVSPTVVNTIVRWNDTVGTSIKGSGITIDNSDNISGIPSITMNTGGSLRTSTTSTLLLQAYDVDGASYTTFATLTAGNTPTMDLSAAVTIGGQYIYRIGGTDVSLADGGTGASLTAPAGDRILFYDQSAGQVTWLQIGANLTITGTTLDATGGGSSFQQRTQGGTTYTIQPSDNGYLIYFTDTNPITVTIPVGLSANFTFTSARAEGAGVVNHVSDGTSVLHTINGDTDIQNENTAVTWAFQGGNDWYGFGALGAGGTGGGSVNSVSGTTDRITITGTSSDPIVNIAATYAGQNSIITLGTVTTGTWNASTIAITRGGTGLTALGSASQLLRVNAGGTALEYFTPTYISGNQTITLSGDVAGSGTMSISTALATVNSNVGSFGSATQVAQFTVNGKGLITAATNVTITPSASSITGGQPLTEVDDTNVTLTLGGTPSTALLQPISITVGWSGQLSIARGGTGLSTVAQGDILYASATDTLASLPKNTSATRYLSNTGASNAPAWAQINLTNGVTGILPIANGGTGTSTLGTANQISAINNAGTAVEYKSLLLGTTAVSNDLNWALTTANQITLNIPDASATVRGVVTAGTQAIGGIKNFSVTSTGATPTYTFSPSITATATSQVMTAIDIAPTFATGGFATTTNVAMRVRSGRVGINMGTATIVAGLDMIGESSSVSTSIVRLRNSSNSNILDIGNDGILRIGNAGSPTNMGSADYDTGNSNINGSAMYIASLNGFVLRNASNGQGIKLTGTITAAAAVTREIRSIYTVLSYDFTGGTNSTYAYDYDPTFLGTTGLTKYGVLIRPSDARSGFGLGTTLPTAKLHFGAHTTAASTAPIKLTSGTAMTTPEDGALEYHGSHLYFTIGSTRYQLDQQGGGGISGLTAGRVPYASSSTTITDEAGFEYDATNNRLTIPNIRSTASSTELRLESGDTANGGQVIIQNDGQILLRNFANNDYISVIDGTISGVGIPLTLRGSIGETGPTSFGAGDGGPVNNSAADTQILGGNAYTTSGNGNGGEVLIQSGAKRSAGSGTDGRIVLDPRNRYTYTTKDIVVDDSSQGLILKASDGGYWRITVAPTTGVVSSVSATI